MKRPFRRVGLGLVGLLFLVAGCGEEHTTITSTGTATMTAAPTQMATATRTGTPLPAPTNTAIPTPSLTAIPTPSLTAIPTSTSTTVPTTTPTMTTTPVPTNTIPPTNTPTITTSPTPTSTATRLPGEMAARLDLDIRSSADVEIRVTGKDLTAKVTLSNTREVALAGVALEGTGSVHTFAEADALLYSAKFASPPVAGGRCGAEPVSLVLTLFRRGGNDHVGGGIAVYCGANTYAGIPARMLRLAGVLPLH